MNREMADTLQRLAEGGGAYLSDIELFALLLTRGGTVTEEHLVQARTSFDALGGWRGMQREDVAVLQRHVTPTTARLAKVAVEIGRRLLFHASEQRFQIRSPGDVAQLLHVEMSHLDQEHLRVICLDTKNRVQKIQTVYIGSLNSAAVRVGEVFKEALKLNSASIIICHNHPSGDPTPSPEDVMVTKQIVEAGKLLDVEALDHLVIGHDRWVSMREVGLGFK